MRRLTLAVLALALVSVADGRATGAQGLDPPIASTHPNDHGLFADATHGVSTAARDVTHLLTSPLRMDGGDALEVGGFVAAAGLLMLLDDEIRDAANRNAGAFPLRPALETGRFLDPIGYGTMNLYYLGGLGLSYAAGWEPGVTTCGQLLTSFAVYGLLKIPVQEVVGRARPYQNEGNGAFGFDDSTSFPSGHTINAFMLATVVSENVHRSWFTGVAYTGAVCVGLQRIEADAHWASDVFLSAVAGIAIARGVVGLHEQRRLAVMPRTGPAGTGLSLAIGF